MKQATKAVTWVASCCALVGAFEGCDLTAKKDMIGTGHPLTWCHGETIGNAHAGQKFTRAECDSMLDARLPSYWAQIAPAIKVETSDNEKIAFTSTTYNIGSGAFRKSAMLRRLNAGDHKGACNALMQYTHASGRVVKGLVNRRTAERKVCLTPDDGAIAPEVRTAAIPHTVSHRTHRPNPKPKAKPFSWGWWTEA